MSNVSSLGRKKPRIVRSWKLAREKCDAEMGCRVCGAWPVEAAHIWGRDKDGIRPVIDADWHPYVVAPTRICPLCPEHHRAYDAHRLDLGSYLSPAEQTQAVEDANGIFLALRRLWPVSEADRRVAA